MITTLKLIVKCILINLVSPRSLMKYIGDEFKMSIKIVCNKLTTSSDDWAHFSISNFSPAKVPLIIAIYYYTLEIISNIKNVSS